MTTQAERWEARKLSDEQLTELEKLLVAAEKELLTSHKKGSMREKGPAIIDLEFKAPEYIRRLLEDVKAYRLG